MLCKGIKMHKTLICGLCVVAIAGWWITADGTAMAAEAVARIAMTDRDQELVWYTVKMQARLKKAKFEGMYDAYA